MPHGKEGECLVEENLPFQEIKKRDGRVVPFDAEKITQAIFKAARAVGGEDYSLAEELTDEVIAFLSGQKLPGLLPTVEEIQDAVEKVLIERGHARTAKAYILYRDKRTRIREARSELMEVVGDILLEGNSIETPFPHSPAGKMQKIALAASQKYYLDNLLPPEIASAHRRGSFHIHGLGFYSKALGSLQVELQQLFEAGFPAGADILPSDLFSALIALATSLRKNQDDLYEEVSLPGFDLALGEISRGFSVRPAREELARSLKSFMYLLENIPCYAESSLRCSMQIGLATDDEGRAITRFLLQEKKVNKKKGRWPYLIYTLKKGVNLLPGDPNYDLFQLALKTTTRQESLSFSLLDTSFNEPFGTDACYFSNGTRVAENRHGLQRGVGRGDICSVTINLPRLALNARDQEELFFVELDRLLLLAVRMLLHRFEVLAALKARDLPSLMAQRLYAGSSKIKEGDSIQEPLKNGLITIGFTGLPEAVRLLKKGHREEVGELYDLATKIVLHMSRRVKTFAKEYDLNICLGVAGDETGSRRLLEKDRDDFGVLRGITDKEHYSPSFILFQEDEGLERKMALEGEIHRHCLAGYSSKLIVLPGLGPEGIEEMLLKVASADIGYVQVKTFGAM